MRWVRARARAGVAASGSARGPRPARRRHGAGAARGRAGIAPVFCVGISVSARISKNRSTCTYARYSQGAAGCVSAL